MTKIPCPKCNSQAYDDNSIFCYKCGTHLSSITQETLPGLEKKKNLSHSYKTLFPENKTPFIIDDPLPSQKPAPVQPVRPEHPGDTPMKPPSASVHNVGPIEICARCGVPVLHKNWIFCENCRVHIREELVGDGTILKHPVPEHRHQEPETRMLKEEEPVLLQGTGTRIDPKVRKVIMIISGIVIIVIMLVLVFMFIVSFWVSLY